LGGPLGGGIGQLGGQFGMGGHPLLQHILGQQFGGGFGQWGSPFGQGFGQGFGGGASSLFGGQSQGIDPMTVALLLQQSSPWGQSQMPIRPLMNPQQLDPVQVSAVSGGTMGVGTDPYSVLAQTRMTPFGISPIYQAMRPQISSPWTTIAGIPCL
jgi:hypothetical protein